MATRLGVFKREMDLFAGVSNISRNNYYSVPNYQVKMYQIAKRNEVVG